ncbi:MAG TPA: hypothetical protein VK524_22840 [Polyangiaceae bacterium]|nr:hypothetical protein [Polyangiaceae bacterium]
MNRHALLGSLAAGLALGCGSNPQPDAQSSNGAHASASEHTAAGEDAEAEPETAAPSLPSCEDGTCFTCGDTICLSGFYCDTGAAGGPACSWLPACTKGASCGCVKKELGAGCSCEERSGGLHVTCS